MPSVVGRQRRNDWVEHARLMGRALVPVFFEQSVSQWNRHPRDSLHVPLDVAAIRRYWALLVVPDQRSGFGSLGESSVD